MCHNKSPLSLTKTVYKVTCYSRVPFSQRMLYSTPASSENIVFCKSFQCQSAENTSNIFQPSKRQLTPHSYYDATIASLHYLKPVCTRETPWCKCYVNATDKTICTCIHFGHRVPFSHSRARSTCLCRVGDLSWQTHVRTLVPNGNHFGTFNSHHLLVRQYTD